MRCIPNTDTLCIYIHVLIIQLLEKQTNLYAEGPDVSYSLSPDIWTGSFRAADLNVRHLNNIILIDFPRPDDGGGDGTESQKNSF